MTVFGVRAATNEEAQAFSRQTGETNVRSAVDERG